MGVVKRRNPDEAHSALCGTFRQPESELLELKTLRTSLQRAVKLVTHNLSKANMPTYFAPNK